MKNSVRLLSLLALAGGSVAVAAPRESITLTNVPSIGRQGAAGNFVTTLNATGTDGGGSYTVRAINFSGSIGNFRGVSWQREAMVFVTPPTGTPFIVAPGTLNTAATTTYTGFRTIPVSAVTTAGTWTFEFFDDFDDATASGAAASEATLGAYDSLWSTVTIALDDAAPAAPSPGSGPSVTYTSVDSDGVAAAPGQTRTWSNTTAFSPALPAVRIRGRVVSLKGNDSAVIATGVVNEPGNTRISITPPGGTSITAWGTDLAITSMGTIDQRVTLPAGTATVGDWNFSFFEGIDIAGGADNRWTEISFELVDIVPAATTIPLVDGGTWNTATGTIPAASNVVWFTFTTPGGLDSTGGLDIDTVGTNLSPSNDTDIGLYTTAGVVVDSDEDDSTDLLSQLSYGPTGTRRNASGNGALFRAQDGTTAGGAGNMAAGTQYFLAVAGGNAATHAATFNTSGGANTGSVTARVRVWSSNAPVDPITPPVSTNLGNFTGVGTTETVSSHTWTMTSATEVKWFKFAIPADAVAASTNYVDIDTDDTNPGAASDTGNVQDTYMVIYRATGGAAIVTDDDDGIDQRSAFSFGDNVNIRPANTPTAPNAVGVARNGRDGSLVAGTYYFTVSTYLPVYGADFDVSPDTSRTAIGSRTVAVRTNFTLAPSCVCCNLSNVAGPNQSTTPDDVLTADDIIVFLGWFFANDGRANVAGANQSTIPDNVLTADDIIVFLGRYFQGC